MSAFVGPVHHGPHVESAGAVAWHSLLLSIIFSSALAALLVASVGALTSALVLLLPLPWKYAQLLSAWGVALFGGFYVAARGVGEAFRMSSGAPLNLGTLEFLFEGIAHLLIPLLIEYSEFAIGLLILAILSGVGFFLFLSRTPIPQASASALASRGGLSFALLLLLVHVLTTPGMAASGGLRTTADLALLSSVAARLDESVEIEQGDESEILPGAPLSYGSLWEKTVTHMGGPRPDVVIIMLESVGLDHLGYEGYSRKVTPHLDRIARDSVRFREARTTATHSNYAQMAVLSSLFPRRYSGLDTYRRLDYPRVLWHDFLGQAGYTTATHSSQDETWQGMLRFQSTKSKISFHHSRTYEGEHLRMGSELIVPDEVTATRAIQWMERVTGPRGLYLNFQSTHFPYKIPRGAARSFQPEATTPGKVHFLNYPDAEKKRVVNRYDNALAYVDAQVGRIYEYLKTSGRLENTLLIVVSDHGELFGEHEMVTHGRSLYDAEARVPLLVHFPTRYKACDVLTPVSTLDVLPTIAAVLEVPAHPAFQGQSLWEENLGSERAIFMNIQGMKSQEAVICDQMKLIHDRTDGQFFLFDLAQDPGEEKNLFNSRPQLAHELHQLLSTQMRAQMSYHALRNPSRRSRNFAPRLASCPTAPQSEITAQLHDSASQ